ncbi:MAG TPA: tRNA (adenosine(37)-N6)-threonylcarbamoyltransferase complex dimerization subunit type 1 TsaB [Hyphomicrobiaceae bacterium]|nr:tRNA (adenosine(37)-N6)-threonylcarbamoyltransferase complex dimerization subunit type 1 TsaB [Hyphomicrobiaceae bacterium]
MNILAFDTCFAACSVAAAKSLDPRKITADGIISRFEQMERGHAERLVPMIGDVMSAAGLGFGELDRIAVTYGPGSFTGTRISLAAARALAASFAVDVVAVSSLAVMAQQAARSLALASAGVRDEGEGMASLLIAADARRDEVYVQQFQTSGADRLTEPLLLSVYEAAKLGGAAPLVVAGSGAVAVAAAANAAGRRARAHLPGLLPDAVDLCRLAATMQPGGEAIKPLYLRPADAKPQTGKSIERATP